MEELAAKSKLVRRRLLKKSQIVEMFDAAGQSDLVPAASCFVILCFDPCRAPASADVIIFYAKEQKRTAKGCSSHYAHVFKCGKSDA